MNHWRKSDEVGRLRAGVEILTTRCAALDIECRELREKYKLEV
jgi:hypothetical protein